MKIMSDKNLQTYNSNKSGATCKTPRLIHKIDKENKKPTNNTPDIVFTKKKEMNKSVDKLKQQKPMPIPL